MDSLPAVVIPVRCLGCFRGKLSRIALLGNRFARINRFKSKNNGYSFALDALDCNVRDSYPDIA